MLRTLNELRAEAADVIRVYTGFKNGDVESLLKKPTGDLPSRHEVEVVAEQAGRIGAWARRVLNHADAATLTEDERHDLTAIADELEAAAAEGAAISEPDEVWKGMNRDQKRRITERFPIQRQSADKLRARIRGDIRKQTPPGNPGNGPK